MIISRRAGNLSPYVPGEQPGQPGLYIKLNTNESPFPPSPEVENALKTYRWEDLRLYPDSSSHSLRQCIAHHYNLKEEQVFAGNGSDEVLSFAWYAFFDPANGPLLFPQHTYSFYPVYSDFYEQSYRRIPLAEDYGIDIDAFIEAMSDSYAGVIFPNPNAPTGMALPLEKIERVLEASRGERLVIVDEAYVDFGCDSCISLIDRYPNLLVIHTCSKSRSLAGLRVGYALGNSDLIETLTAVKDSFNSYPLDRLSQKIAEIAIQDEAYYSRVREKTMEIRDWFSASISRDGWQVLPSRANFIFARLPGTPGADVYRDLKNRGFLVRHFSIPGIEDFLRITIGTDKDMEKLYCLLKELYHPGKDCGEA
jgi:histidinol-phosphate aminotransferase